MKANYTEEQQTSVRRQSKTDLLCTKATANYLKGLPNIAHDSAISLIEKIELIYIESNNDQRQKLGTKKEVHHVEKISYSVF